MIKADNFDQLLEIAFGDISDREFELYPNDAELKKYTVSESCDEAVRRMIKRYYLKKTVRAVVKFSKKVASIALAVLGTVTVIACVTSEEVRAICKKYFTVIYTEFIDFVFPEDVERENIKYPEWVDGYRLNEIQEIQNTLTKAEYVKDGTVITVIYYYNQTLFDVMIDNENYYLEKADIFEYEGTYFWGKTSETENQIAIEYKKGLLKVRGILSIDDLKIFLKKYVNFVAEK